MLIKQSVMLAFASAMFVASAMQSTGMEFSVHPNTNKKLTAVMAQGEIVEGDLERLQKFLSAQPARQRIAVYFDSPGGSLYTGMSLGRFFRTYRIKTVVEGGKECASACALAFLGGTDSDGNPWRSSSDNSQLGFHEFHTPGQPVQNEGDTQKTVAAVLRYGHEVQAPLELMVLNFETSADNIYWLNSEEICSLGIKLWSNITHVFVC